MIGEPSPLNRIVSFADSGVNGWEPTGIKFNDLVLGPMILITEGPYRDWIAYLHKERSQGWVTLRIATDADRALITGLKLSGQI
jgi:hypothetical protein